MNHFCLSILPSKRELVRVSGSLSQHTCLPFWVKTVQSFFSVGKNVEFLRCSRTCMSIHLNKICSLIHSNVQSISKITVEVKTTYSKRGAFDEKWNFANYMTHLEVGSFTVYTTTWLNYTDFQYACVLVNPSDATPLKGRFLWRVSHTHHGWNCWTRAFPFFPQFWGWNMAMV